MFRTHHTHDDGDLVRHLCRACGMSCHGVQVGLRDAEERARILTLGRQLGIAAPLDEDGRLAQAEGHCVFQGQDGLCELHRRFGAAAKPLVCRQFPLIVLQAEEGIRVGVDPACYHARASWKEGPVMDSGQVLSGRVALPEPQRALEDALLHELEAPGQTLTGVLRVLGGAGPGEGPPPGFSARLVERLRAADLRGFFATPGAPGVVGRLLEPVLAGAERWEAVAPPPDPRLPPAADAWAVEVVRRVVFLRLHAMSVPVVNGAALLMAAGAWACAWVEQDPDRYGTLLAAWARALRYRAFWLRIAPSGPALGWLATGR